MRGLFAVAALLLWATSLGAQSPLVYVAFDEPCRLLDTRATPPGLAPGVIYPVQAVDSCGIPFEAKAIQANLTATNTKGPGFLALVKAVGRPSAAPPPKTSVLNFTGPGQTVANSALITLGKPIEHWGGVFWLVAEVSGTDAIVDVSGYYVEP